MIGRLKKLEIQNFRSINDRVSVRLDAPVVLIHGSNGVGKTSLLTAIEYAATGTAASLEGVEPSYRSQLLNYEASTGEIILSYEGGDPAHTTIKKSGTSGVGQLSQKRSEFFSERCYLAQSALSQLINMYQDSTTDINSSLSRFVNELLGLDRLDAIERGLHASLDLRNTKKLVPSYLALDRHRDSLRIEVERLTRAFEEASSLVAETEELVKECIGSLRTLGVNVPDDKDSILTVLQEELELSRLSELADINNRVNAAARMLARLDRIRSTSNKAALEEEFARFESQLKEWRSVEGSQINAVLQDADSLALVGGIKQDANFGESFQSLKSQWAEFSENLEGKLSADAQAREREQSLSNERIQLQARVRELSRQVESVGGETNSLSQALTVIIPHTHFDDCPVCMRSYSEVSSEPLYSLVSRRIGALGDLAERLSQLAREQASSQRRLNELELEILDAEAATLSVEDRLRAQDRLAKVKSLVEQGERLQGAADAGGFLIERSVTLRRNLEELSAADGEERVLRGILADLARSLDPVEIRESETFANTLARLEQASLAETTKLRNVTELKLKTRSTLKELGRFKETMDARKITLEQRTAALELADRAFADAESLRATARKIVKEVAGARGQVVRNVFNDRLNKLWRDLFVRLAPLEDFIPMFILPEKGRSTSNVPQIRTRHRALGRDGGAPGAMLSAGNLNTAALTLFLALHLSVEVDLPWLLLDDPVQSMDDVHISQFAALLRTISKEQGRQVIIAVHDRSLFDYLRLEMSPAYPGDELITIELSRSSQKRTRVRSERHAFRPDKALQVAAE